MAIINRQLQLLEPVERRGLRHPIDFFFRSLAQDQRERAVGIILSGTGTEGTLGLKAVKGEGGLSIAQDPNDARYGGMPGSAIAGGLVDYVLPAQRMAEHLMKYSRSPLVRPPQAMTKIEGKADYLQKIFILIRAQTGHDFSLYKQNTILRRIERRMAIHQIEDLSHYVRYLRENAHEVEALFRELLIRVTNFFRDPEAFETVKKEVVPHLLGNRSYDAPVRIWVPGCSTGEEAYSLAILFREHMQEIEKNHKIQIFATDIDTNAIETARNGVYPESITVDVSPERLSRYFIKQDTSYRVKDDIREMVVFAVQNLIKDPPFSKLEMISCRNLLIYLGTELQKKVIPLFRYALNSEGILFLGSSETIGDFSDIFSVFNKKWKIYKATRSPSLPPPMDMRTAAPPERDLREKGFAGKKPGDISVGDLAERFLLEYYSPSCAIVNERGDILYLHGRTGKYLEPAPGKASLNALTMAREGLQLELRTALRKAVARKEDVISEGLRVRTNGDFQTINLEVKYIRKPETLQGLIMIVFIDVPAPPRQEDSLERGDEERINKRVMELEFEVKSTKEHLQTTIEELETANEELKSTNEELQSSNEELQSTNEELETSKEELQSVNEELLTVNAELQNKIDELSQVNNDMSNLLVSTQIATIFLNNALRIKRLLPGYLYDQPHPDGRGTADKRCILEAGLPGVGTRCGGGAQDPRRKGKTGPAHRREVVYRADHAVSHQRKCYRWSGHHLFRRHRAEESA
ncbi:MAG: CheR family methyltransferase, partial [Thermodesulfovibrionales bacterium]